MKHENDLMDCMIAIIRAQSTDFNTARLAAQVIAADGYFNRTVANFKQSGVPIINILQLIELSADLLDEAKNLAADVNTGIGASEIQEKLISIATRIRSWRVDS